MSTTESIIQQQLDIDCQKRDDISESRKDIRQAIECLSGSMNLSHVKTAVLALYEADAILVEKLNALEERISLYKSFRG